jgi:transcriptional regulator with XRE-family HTH domain
MTDFETFIRARITELRLKKNVSEHRMSLDLGKSGSYLRGISNGASLPSLRELSNIISYFEMTPSEFFSPMEPADTPYALLCERLRGLDEADLEKVNTLLNWIGK